MPLKRPRPGRKTRDYTPRLRNDPRISGVQGRGSPFAPSPTPMPMASPTAKPGAGRDLGLGGPGVQIFGQPFMDPWKEAPPPSVYPTPLTTPGQQGLAEQLGMNLQELLGGPGAEGAQAAGQAALQSILGGGAPWSLTPERVNTLSDYLGQMQKPVETQMMQDWLPRAREQAGGMGLFQGTDRMQMENELMRRTGESMAGQRAEALSGLFPLEAQSANLARQLQLGGVHEAFQQGQAPMSQAMQFLRTPLIENLVNQPIYRGGGGMSIGGEASRPSRYSSRPMGLEDFINRFGGV